MERIWTVPPDPATGLVDRNEFVQALMDAEAHLWRSGGVVTVLVGRQPTLTQGEMVTTSALVQWKDRTDARPQPEVAGDVVEQPVAEALAAVEEDAEPETEGAPAAEELEEDVSEIPVAMR